MAVNLIPEKYFGFEFWIRFVFIVEFEEDKETESGVGVERET